VALCQRLVEPVEGTDKEELIARESDYFLEAKHSKYNHHFSIVGNTIVGAAGIDTSNADGNYVLWPADPQKSANEIRQYLTDRFKIMNTGVIITDSISIPLRRGSIVTCI